MESNIDKRFVLLITAMGSFLTPFMGSATVVALPSIGQEFLMNSVLLNWVSTAYLLAAAIFVVPFGRLADIYGRKKVYFLGVLIFTVSTVLCGMSISAAMLVLTRVLQGIGSAMMFGTGVAMVTAVFSLGERGRALGMNVAVTYLGLSTGPLLGGVLTHHFGWRSIFYSIVPLGIIIIVTILWKLKVEWIEARGEKFDFPGSIIYGVGLLGVMFGFSMMKTVWLGSLIIFIGISALFLFVLFENKAQQPVLNMNLFKNSRVLLFSTVAALINYSATNAVSFLLSLYLQYIKGFDPQQAGLILIAQPAVQALLSPMAGKLSDKMEPQKVASIGMGVSTLGLVFFIFLSSTTTVTFIILGLMLLGFGFALFSSPNTNAVMSSVEKRYYGVTSGLLGTARLVGQTLSMGVSALIFAVYIGNVRITQEYHLHFIKSVNVLFIIFTLLCVAGIFASLARGSMHGSKAEKNGDSTT